MPAVRRPGASNQAEKPLGAAPAPSLVLKSSRPLASQKRMRVSTLMMKRRRAGPLSVESQRSGSIAVHGAQEVGQVRAAQHCFHFGGQGQGLGQIPLRHDARVHHQPAVGMDRHRLLTQPVQQGRSVRGAEDVIHRVAPAGRANAVGHREQVQVVVAEQAGGGATEVLQQPQSVERRWASVDQVAQQDDLVTRRRKRQCRQKPLQCGAAALDVADQVGGHLGIVLSEMSISSASLAASFNRPRTGRVSLLSRALLMDTALVLFLILLNGLFAMSEMALTASRKARLQVMVESNESGAQAAMDLHENPTKFLSTVQIGITSIGVLNGIVGDAAFSGPLSAWLVGTFNLPANAAADHGDCLGGGHHHRVDDRVRRVGAQAGGADLPGSGGALGGAADEFFVDGGAAAGQVRSAL